MQVYGQSLGVGQWQWEPRNQKEGGVMAALIWPPCLGTMMKSQRQRLCESEEESKADSCLPWLTVYPGPQTLQIPKSQQQHPALLLPPSSDKSAVTKRAILGQGLSSHCAARPAAALHPAPSSPPSVSRAECLRESLTPEFRKWAPL